MMMMFHKANFYVFLLAIIVFWGSCKDSPKIKEPAKAPNKSFTLSDATRLELPATFILSENLNSENQLVAEVYADFLANLDSPPMKVTFFVDSLKPHHHLATYLVDYQPYNQNMAALLNSQLTQQFQHFDEHQAAYTVSKVESMQYASTAWKALKFKFELTESPSEEDTKPSPQKLFATIFYYNGQNKAYFFLEYFDKKDDLDAYLRKIHLVSQPES